MGEFILNGRNYGGSIITPNPSDTPTDSLDSIKIGDTTYEIQGGGGGGSEVIPNPQGAATDTLNTVEIDGTVYGIEGGGGSSLIIDAQRYSLDEQVVGIWTDGKPIYQKTMTISIVNVQDFTLADDSVSYDKLIYSNGIVYINITNPTWISHSSNRQNSPRIAILPDHKLYYYADDLATEYSWRYQFTIQYTKTTDTAGSGGYQAYGFSPIIYSDTEREVGVWRDGKPLYQRTFVATSPSATDTTTSIITMPTGIENVVSLVGFINQSGAIAQENVNYYMWYRKSQNDIACRVANTNWKSCPMFVTVRYTKLADVAGSGEYNTLAIPNVHYSTDEQVIGTWIDGSTLYQKTKVISFSELTHQGNLYYKQFRETGENVVDVKAKAVSTSYGMCYLGCKNYTMNNEESYWELIMYYNNICLKFTGTTATDTNVSTITVTYQYTKTTD